MPEDGRPKKGRMCMSAVEKIERQQAKEKGRTAAWMVAPYAAVAVTTSSWACR